jgi:hypothetical protein
MCSEHWDLVTPVAGNVLSEIHFMRGALGKFSNAIDFPNLEKSVVASRTRIERLILDGKIDPRTAVRHIQ